jgi:hypothetical protein
MLWRWNSTVFWLMCSRVATSLFVKPSATADATRRSAGDSTPSSVDVEDAATESRREAVRETHDVAPSDSKMA